jgi:hypothetical protein
VGEISIGIKTMLRPSNVKLNVLLRIGSVLAFFSIPVLIISALFHGGHNPANLQDVLPEYSANSNWKAVHLGQFVGFLMMIGSVVVLLDYIRGKTGTPFALLGLLTAFVAASIYAANHAVDGVAIKYVADTYVDASPADKATAFRLAEAVRHVEQGLSSMVAINLGFTLLLCGGAIVLTDVFAKGLGWAALVVGCGYTVSGLFLNYVGFSQHVFSFWTGNLLLIWLLAMAISLWRESNRITKQ